MNRRRSIVAIDGPAGAGKSTIARAVAARLGYAYLDSGAMYRCVALGALERAIPIDDAEAVGDLARGMDIAFASGAHQNVLLEGRDVTEAIRTPEVSAAASRVSVHSGVRRAMVARQRRLGEAGGVVMEGRDIGSVVFPRAEVKVYLTASDAERARRRAEQRRRAGLDFVNVEGVLAEIRERDERDRTRADSPLLIAEGARELITDWMSPDAVVDCI
ncbi:MAG: (d)CMP kinase, partial [Armatimonadota bacterium]